MEACKISTLAIKKNQVILCLQTGMSNSQYFGPKLMTAGDNPMFNVKGNSSINCHGVYTRVSRLSI